MASQHQTILDSTVIEFRQILTRNPNLRPYDAASQLLVGPRTWIINREELFKEFEKKYNISVVEYCRSLRKNSSKKPPESSSVLAVNQLAYQIKMFPKLDLILEAYRICQKFRVNDKKLANAFQDKYGLTPFDYQKSYNEKKAGRILNKPDLNRSDSREFTSISPKEEPAKILTAWEKLCLLVEKASKEEVKSDATASI